jgi:RHS repeat-associated protein
VENINKKKKLSYLKGEPFDFPIPICDLAEFAFDYVNGELILKNGNIYTYHYCLKDDHLGNNRIVMNASGNVVQLTNYYPSGTVMAELPVRTDQGVQPYKFGDKELDRSNGLDFYDFVWRQYDPTLMRFTTPDPLAEKYYAISPYAYCMNNPVRYTDSTGM